MAQFIIIIFIIIIIIITDALMFMQHFVWNLEDYNTYINCLN